MESIKRNKLRRRCDCGIWFWVPYSNKKKCGGCSPPNTPQPSEHKNKK